MLYNPHGMEFNVPSISRNTTPDDDRPRRVRYMQIEDEGTRMKFERGEQRENIILFPRTGTLLNIKVC